MNIHAFTRKTFVSSIVSELYEGFSYFKTIVHVRNDNIRYSKTMRVCEIKPTLLKVHDEKFKVFSYAYVLFHGT